MEHKNIKNLHPAGKMLSAVALFRSEHGNASAIQILKGGILKDHSTSIPALLLCMDGEVLFENEKGLKLTLQPGDYVHIEENILHRVLAVQDSQCILFK